MNHDDPPAGSFHADAVFDHLIASMQPPGPLPLIATGVAPEQPFHSCEGFDGLGVVIQRRPELLAADDLAGWWRDLDAWTGWLIATYRLARWLPPCWSQHPALVEEVMGLWVLWQNAWLPATDPNSPAGFHWQLDIALGRIENRWQIPCTPDHHTTPPPVPASCFQPPTLRDWWSSAHFTVPYQW